MHACMSLASLTVRTAYCREVAWLDIVVRIPEMVLTRSGRAQECRGAAANGGVSVFFWCKDISQQQQTQICHSKTDGVHSYFLARVVCIPVHFSLIDVEGEGQLCIRSFVRLFIHSFIGGYAAS